MKRSQPETDGERKERIRSYRYAAKRGDRTYRAALGWEHLREERNRKGLKKALKHFDMLKRKHRNYALFEIARAKYIVGDASYAKDLQKAVASEYAPALYLKATIGWHKGERAEPLSLFLQAAKAGHLPSTIIWLRQQPRSIFRRIWGLPLLIVTIFEIAGVYTKNPYDERVMPFVCGPSQN